mgnify:CR=1 FL=1
MQKFSLKVLVFFVSFFILAFGANKVLAAPFITSVSPTSVLSNTSFTLTINGTDFDKTSIITIGGQQKITNTANTPTQLSAQIPASDIPGTGFILVGVFTGSCNCSSNFISIPGSFVRSGCPWSLLPNFLSVRHSSTGK